MSPKQRISLFLEESHVVGLQALKERDGIPNAEAIRRALAEYLRKHGVTGDEKTARKRAATRRRA